MGYFKNLLIGIDQLGNAFAGGNPDNTISARVGFICHKDKIPVRPFWITLRWVIDWTFWPVDGKDHCHEAYHADENEVFHENEKVWPVVIVSIFIFLTCPIFAFILYTLYLFKIVNNDVDVIIEH